MPSSPMSAKLGSLSTRFAPRQLLRRAFWPLWLGLGIGLGAVMMTWTATTTYESLRYCYSYEYACYNTTWSSSSWGGFGAGNLTLPLVLALVGVALWAAARRDHAHPAWVARVPVVATVVLVGVAVVSVPEAVALSDWLGEEPTSGLVQTYDPAGGPFFMLLAAWPLWVGVRRVRRIFDSAPGVPVEEKALGTGPTVATAG